MSIEVRVREIIVCLLEEMRAPVHILEGVYLILRDKVSPGMMPAELTVPIRAIGRISAKILSESQYLIRFVEDEFTVHSPVKAASQIRQKVAQWKEGEQELVNTMQQLQRAREEGSGIKDPDLDAVVGEALFNAFNCLRRWLDYLGAIEGKDLVYWDNDRILRVSSPQYKPTRKSEMKLSTSATARSYVYELMEPLRGLEFGHSSLKENTPHEILAPIDAIGKCSKKFQEEVKSFGDAFLTETDLTPDKAVEQIHQQVKAWKAYEIELSHAIRQIREALASGLTVDADIEAIIAGAFFDAFEHLEREMRRLETIKAEDF